MGDKLQWQHFVHIINDDERPTLMSRTSDLIGSCGLGLKERGRDSNMIDREIYTDREVVRKR